VPNSFQNFSYVSSSIFLNMSKACKTRNNTNQSYYTIILTFLTSFFLMTFNSLCCCSVSLDTFSGRSSESTYMYQSITTWLAQILSKYITHYSMNEVQVFRKHVFKIISDKHSTYIQLVNTMRLMSKLSLTYLNLFSYLAVILEHISWSILGHIKDTFKGHFSFSSEVNLSQWLIIVLK